MIKEVALEITTGHDIYLFHIPFVRTRAELNLISNEFSILCKWLPSLSCGYIETIAKCIQMGTKETEMYLIPGTLFLDTYLIIKKTLTFPSYSLQYISQVFIKSKTENPVYVLDKNNSSKN